MPARCAGDIPQRCDLCGDLHWLRRTDRPMAAARQCDSCGTRHPVRQNEVWFESANAGGLVERWLRTCWELRASVECACRTLVALHGWLVLGCSVLPLTVSPATALLPCPAPGFMRRSIHMFCCYKGAVYDMR